MPIYFANGHTYLYFPTINVSQRKFKLVAGDWGEKQEVFKPVVTALSFFIHVVKQYQ